MSRRRTNPFTNRKANVSVHRNGLSIEIQDVSAVDSGLVAKELLDIVRQLVAAGYEELVVDAGALHGGGFETPDERSLPVGAAEILPAATTPKSSESGSPDSRRSASTDDVSAAVRTDFRLRKRSSSVPATPTGRGSSSARR